jgi:hypothetical protein
MNVCSATTGRELRNLVDVEIDPDTGQMTGITMGVHSMPADALIGVGRYVTVVVDPELSWHSRQCGWRLIRTPATIGSDRPDLATACDRSGTDQLSSTYERWSVAARRAITEP